MLPPGVRRRQLEQTAERAGGVGVLVGEGEALALSPVPMEVYPSLAFDSLFENRGSKRNQSILDRVQSEAKSLSSQVSTGDKAKLENPAIQNGLRALGQHIGTPSKDAAARPAMQNLYFLWSVERVAMLYDLKTIGGKDWYGWGAQILLANQQPDGQWNGGQQYTGEDAHLDTCFALLFLKRSNLVSDLTENLRLHMVIRDPGAK